MCYGYKRMSDETEKIREQFECVRCRSIGKSVMGRDILCLSMGRGEKKLLLSGAFHGLEYLTAAFLVKLTEELAKSAQSGNEYMGYDLRGLFDKLTLYVVPMINPDGVDIAAGGIDMKNPFHRNLIDEIGIHDFQSVWQANINGVDINHNFDAHWRKTLDAPAPSRYGGEMPESEPEARAAADLVREEKFDMVIAFHSQGSEIYYDFEGKEAERSYDIARKMAKVSGYKVSKPSGTASYGGFKDWFIDEFGREGFTVEMGKGKNPLPMEMLDRVYGENARMVLCAMNEL